MKSIGKGMTNIEKHNKMYENIWKVRLKRVDEGGRRLKKAEED